MRRKDKQITDLKVLTEIIENNTICRIAFSEEDNPYILPMNYGFDNNTIYIHSAKEGKKIDIIKVNDKICFEITDSIESVKSENACSFTTKYRSVIGYGKIFPVIDNEEKVNALKIIMKQHTQKTDWSFNESVLDKVIVLKIKIESMTGKSTDD